MFKMHCELALCYDLLFTTTSFVITLGDFKITVVILFCGTFQILRRQTKAFTQFNKISLDMLVYYNPNFYFFHFYFISFIFIFFSTVLHPDHSYPPFCPPVSPPPLPSLSCRSTPLCLPSEKSQPLRDINQVWYSKLQ